MPNEDMVKLVKILDALGYRVVSINTQIGVSDSLGNMYANGKIEILITPVEKASS